ERCQPVGRDGGLTREQADDVRRARQEPTHPFAHVTTFAHAKSAAPRAAQTGRGASPTASGCGTACPRTWGTRRSAPVPTTADATTVAVLAGAPTAAAARITAAADACADSESSGRGR